MFQKWENYLPFCLQRENVFLRDQMYRSFYSMHKTTYDRITSCPVPSQQLAEWVIASGPVMQTLRVWEIMPSQVWLQAIIKALFVQLVWLRSNIFLSVFM